jgi:hypothetical protein
MNETLLARARRTLILVQLDLIAFRQNEASASEIHEVSELAHKILTINLKLKEIEDRRK